MRAFSFALLFSCLLGLFALSFPADWKAPDTRSLGEYDGHNDLEVVVEGLDLGLASKEDDVSEADLEKRRARGGRARARPARPKKTKKAKKAKAKKSKKAKKAKKNKCTAPGKGGKHSRRAPGAKGDSCPEPTADYKTVLAAAKKAGTKTLTVGQTYMLIYKRGTIDHRVLIIGTVTQNSQGQLDFEAFAYELTKDKTKGDPNTSEFKKICNTLVGAECDWNYFELWNCGRQGAKKYSFKGEAKPEFADPDHVQATSQRLIARDKKYTFYYNNCWKFAKDAANIGGGGRMPWAFGGLS